MYLLELLPILSYLAGLLTLFTEFFLDCSDLLAEVVLSLGLVDLGFHVALDLPCKLQHIDFFGEEFGDAVKSFFCIRCSKQRLPVFGPKQKTTRNKVCEPVRFRDTGDIVYRLRRQFPGQLDVLRKLVENNAHESLALRGRFLVCRQWLDAGHKHLVVVRAHIRDANSADALYENSIAPIGQLEQLQNLSTDADIIEIGKPGVFVRLVLLAYKYNLAVGRQRRLDALQRLWPAHKEGKDMIWKNHYVPQGNQWRFR